MAAYIADKRNMGSYEEADDPVLGNGDTLLDRLEALDLNEADTCSTDYLCERFDL